jgi:hypothetical protein
MKLIISSIFSLFILYSNAQTVLYSENFESYPINKLYVQNSGKQSIPNDASPCSYASRGNTTNFNSTHVDFKSSQNSSYFLGVNPESPCGGYYSATIVSDPLDFSGVSTLYLKGRYIQTTTLGWGSTALSITLSNGTKDTTFQGNTYFPANDKWNNFSIKLTSDYIKNNIVITIGFTAGDGIAVDDIEISGSPLTTGTIKANDELYKSFDVYPTMVSDLLHVNNINNNMQNIKASILNMEGVIKMESSLQNTQEIIDVSKLMNGIYLLKLTTPNGDSFSYRLVKE